MREHACAGGPGSRATHPRHRPGTATSTTAAFHANAQPGDLNPCTRVSLAGSLARDSRRGRPRAREDTREMPRPEDWPAPAYDDPLAQRLRDIGAGLMPPPTSTARRHHYVPQILLRGFESHTKPKHIWYLDKASGQSRQVSISSAGFEPRLYAAKSDDGDYDNRIEGFLSLVEGYAAPALAELLDGTLTAESVALPCFLGLQVMRTPTVLDSIGLLTQQLGQAELETLLNDPCAFARFLSQRYEEQLAPSEIERRRQSHLKALRQGVRIHLANKREVALNQMVDSVLEAAFAMAHADWYVLYSDTRPFVLNDCGYARINATDGLPRSGILFPIRSDACLLVAAPTSDDMRIYRARCDPPEITKLNLRTYGWATDFVFGHSQDAVTSVRAAARRHPKGAHPPAWEERLPGPPSRVR